MAGRAWTPVEIAGDAPLLLLAPHGGLRDHAATPWGSRPLKMNDVHTAALTRELAAATGASAVINDTLDRNLVDLNRISAAADDAPAFLDATCRALERLAVRHARVTVYVVHGWNVGEPIVDVGFGVRPGRDDDLAAIDHGYRAAALPRLCDALAASGIRVTVAARYPARGRENLVQLFTGRHAGASRPLVRDVSAWAGRVDAVQLELGLPLRFPGPWRDRFIAALQAVAGVEAAPPASRAGDDVAGVEAAVQFAGTQVSGLVRVGPGGGVLALVLPDGGMLSFTGERVGDALPPPGVVGGLRLTRRDGALLVAYRGPALRHPDTRAFEDLERGLTTARVVEVAFDLSCAVDDDGFGAAHGVLDVGDVRHPIAAVSAVTVAAPPVPGLRVALRLGPSRTLAATTAGGVLRDGGAHIAVVGLDAEALHDRRVDLRLHLGDGRHERVNLELVDRVPVVRNVPGPLGRTLHATCRLLGALAPSGWIELADLPGLLGAC